MTKAECSEHTAVMLSEKMANDLCRSLTGKADSDYNIVYLKVRLAHPFAPNRQIRKESKRPTVRPAVVYVRQKVSPASS